MGDYVRYKDVKEGTGEVPIRGHTVHIAYTMTLANGRRISSEDASQKHQLPLKRRVPVAVGKVCRGVDMALQSVYLKLQLMTSNAGGRRTHRCDSSRVRVWREGVSEGRDQPQRMLLCRFTVSQVLCCLFSQIIFVHVESLRLSLSASIQHGSRASVCDCSRRLSCADNKWRL